MGQEKRTITVLGASSLTAALVAATIYFAVPYRLLNGVRREFDYPVDLLILMAGALVMYLIVSIPGILLLRRQSVPHSTVLSLFAVTEAWTLSYGLLPILVDVLGSWAAIPGTVFLLVLSYILSDSLFNRWKISLKLKLTVAGLLMILTALVTL